MSTETLKAPKKSSAKDFTPQTFILLKHLDATAPVFQRLNKNQRVRLTKRPYDKAYLKNTFTTADGKVRTSRFKLNSDSIWQDEQIAKGIPANEPFTPREEQHMIFRNGVLVTKNRVVYEYLINSPQYDRFEGERPDGMRPMYTLVDKETETRTNLEEVKRTAQAVNKITGIKEIKDAKSLLHQIMGSFYRTGETLEDCQMQLVELVQNDEDGKVIDAILAGKTNLDQHIKADIGAAISKGELSFDAVPDQVVRKINDQWVKVFDVASTIDIKQRYEMFADFLKSPEGSSLYDDIKEAIK